MEYCTECGSEKKEVGLFTSTYMRCYTCEPTNEANHPLQEKTKKAHQKWPEYIHGNFSVRLVKDGVTVDSDMWCVLSNISGYQYNGLTGVIKSSDGTEYSYWSKDGIILMFVHKKPAIISKYPSKLNAHDRITLRTPYNLSTTATWDEYLNNGYIYNHLTGNIFSTPARKFHYSYSTIDSKVFEEIP